MRLSKMEALLHKLTEKAFAGDIRAITTLIQIYRGSVPDEVLPSDSAAGEGVSPDCARTEQEAAAYEALCELIRDGIPAQSER